MAKRPTFDLSSLTAEAAEPMQEAVQRSAQPTPASPAPSSNRKILSKQSESVATADLVPMNFKVPPAFDKRFRRTAFESDLKLNKLLYQALDAWEEKYGKKA